MADLILSDNGVLAGLAALFAVTMVAWAMRITVALTIISLGAVIGFGIVLAGSTPREADGRH